MALISASLESEVREKSLTSARSFDDNADLRRDKMACTNSVMPGMARGTMTDEYQRDRDAFYMDLENWLVEHKWRAPVPTGPARHLFNSAWGQMMRVEFLDYDPPKDFSWIIHHG